MSSRSSHRSAAGGGGRAARAARLVAGLVGLFALSLSAAAAAAAVPIKPFPATGSGAGSVAAKPGPNKVRFAALPDKNAPNRQALSNAMSAGTTVSGTTYSVTAGQNGDTYSFFIVGPDVVSGSAVDNVPVEVIPVVVTFSGTGDVYDPTSVNTGCGETVSGLTGVLTGPELTRRNWYAGHTFVGHTEYTDAQMREEFWAWTNPKGSSPNWHVYLNGSNPVDASGTFNYPEVDAGTCAELGEIDLNTWDSAIQSFINAESTVIGSTTLPLFIVKNVVWTQNGGKTCCILGYHSAFTDSSGNTQTYAVGSYITDGEFGNYTDLADISHEIAEWANDPFVNNPTPSWGHTGQVSGCQSNLEVGDPLTGNVFAVPPPLPGEPTYHLQELAFFGWFYDYNSGVNGWYSTRGSFTSGASLCS